MERVKLVVKQRDAVGTRPSRRLRREGLIPGVLYGHGNPAQSLAVEPAALREALASEAGRHAVIELTFEGQKKVHRAIVKELTLDKVKHNVIHLDLEEVRLDQVVESQVTVRFEGTSVGVKTGGGMLDEATREVTVKGLVTDIPEHLVADISALDLGDSLHVSDLQVPDGLEVLDDPESVLCSVLAPRKLEAEEEEALEAAEEAAAAEPEVVGRQKEEPEE